MQSHDLPQSTGQSSPRHRRKSWQDYFRLVTHAYRDFRAYSPLIAIQYNEFAIAPKLTPTIIEFLCDVEIATRRVLDGAGLYNQWRAIIREEEVDATIAARIASLCGRIYAARNLDPRRYFQHIRKGRAERRATV